jgi:hypothetical protein
MATQSYRERIKAQRAEASAQRKAEQAARQQQIELRCEVHRLALAAVKAGIQAKGQRKLSTYSRAELTMMANALIAPWFIEHFGPRSLNEVFAMFQNYVQWQVQGVLAGLERGWCGLYAIGPDKLCADNTAPWC